MGESDVLPDWAQAPPALPRRAEAAIAVPRPAAQPAPASALSKAAVCQRCLC